jgi:LmbE family N-acetylglucosaminyl deacetylase
MEWIYLSPHFDDVALSCGGLVWEQVKSGERVSIWTICAAEPPSGPVSPFARSLHARWDTDQGAVSTRREEDRLSSQRMGAATRYFSIPDAIYRRSPIDGSFMYTSDLDLFADLHPQDAELVQNLRSEFSTALPQDCELVCPLTLGGHVDHRLVRLAAEGLDRPLWYYADYPYAVQTADDQDWIPVGMRSLIFPVSETGFLAWVEAVAAHASQISTFWSDLGQMRSAIQTYWQQFEGVRLWQVD